MTVTHRFLRQVIDSVPDHIVVIDRTGAIRFVNRAWTLFGQANGCLATQRDWRRVNYLTVCEDSAAAGEELGGSAAAGIGKVIEQSLGIFYVEYPCHSPTEKRWFMMRAAPLIVGSERYCVITHQCITERKLAEEQVLSLSRTDGLTGLPNRRRFDEFFELEWKRCVRQNTPITVAMMDIDHFKLLNDRYGHPAGDRCLVRIGEVLNGVANRPGDLFARYGGEEFSFVFGDTTTAQSLVPINKIVDGIERLMIPNEASPTKPIVTVSIGIATMHPNRWNDRNDLIKAADELLYSAKAGGRNRLGHLGPDTHLALGAGDCEQGSARLGEEDGKAA